MGTTTNLDMFNQSCWWKRAAALAQLATSILASFCNLISDCPCSSPYELCSLFFCNNWKWMNPFCFPALSLGSMSCSNKRRQRWRFWKSGSETASRLWFMALSASFIICRCNVCCLPVSRSVLLCSSFWDCGLTSQKSSSVHPIQRKAIFTWELHLNRRVMHMCSTDVPEQTHNH